MLVRGALGALPRLAVLEPVVLLVLRLLSIAAGDVRRRRVRDGRRLRIRVADAPQHVAATVRTVPAVEAVVAAAGRRGASYREDGVVAAHGDAAAASG